MIAEVLELVLHIIICTLACTGLHRALEHGSSRVE